MSPARPASPKTFTHAQLVALGVRWAKREGFGVVHGELTSAASREIPDVVAFRTQASVVIECKTSRSDFLVDKAKPWRQLGQGVGNYRFYLAPAGLIAPSELPVQPRWGLIEVDARGKLTDVVRPMGNWWPNPATRPSALPPAPAGHLDIYAEFEPFWHPSDLEVERRMLYSIARRKAQSPKPKT